MELFAINYNNSNIESNSENELLELKFADIQEYQLDTVKRNEASSKQDSTAPKPTIAQIRNWRWMREKKLTVGDSRYMQPKDEVNLTTTVKTDEGKLGLSMREINHVNMDWLTILLLLVIVLLATVRVAYSKYIAHLFQSLVNYSTSFRMFREKNYTILHGAFRLDIIFYLTLSLFVYQVLGFIGKERILVQTNFAFYGFTVLCVLLYFLIKRIAYKVLGSIVESINETNEYLFNMDNYNRSLGLTLIPVVALINYYPAGNPAITVYLGLFMVAIYYLFLLQRGISILLRKPASLFYLFLYLCTLEILPLLLIYKVVVS
jgi:hypothetical protein